MLGCPHGTTTNAASERAEGRTGVAPDLEQRLGEAVPPAGGQPGHAGRLGVEDGRPDAHQSRGDQDRREAVGTERSSKPSEGEDHAGRQRVRLRPAVGGHADERLEQRRGELEREGDEPDLGEAERSTRSLRIGIDGRDEGLDECR